MPLDTQSLILWGLIGLMAVLAAAIPGTLIYFGIRPPRVRGIEIGCGRCGYSIRGATGSVCPECGADWRRVGTRQTQGVTQQERKYFLLLGLGMLLAEVLLGLSMLVP